jgi:uncharacterized membrane protein
MPDAILVILFVVLLLGLAVLVLVLPIMAFVRSRGVAHLRARLDQLEAEVRQASSAAASPSTATSAVAEPHAAELAELTQRLERVEEALSQRPAERKAEVAPRPVRRAVASAPSIPEVLPVEPEVPWQPSAKAVEEWIGRHGLGWAAMLLLLFAAAFFLKYAFENRWIGELGRVAIGILAGAALCLAGLRYRWRGWRIFSQMLTAGGVVLLYLATYAAFGYYHLIPQGRAVVFLVVLVAESAALAALYEAPAIALTALIGGLLVPLLMRTEVDQYRSLFTYLLILNAGMAGLAFFRRWRLVGTVALVGTQLLFWAWFGEHYHPEKRFAALGFQVALFGLYLAYGAGATLVRSSRRASLEDLVRLVLNASFFALAGYVMLDDDYHIWLGPLSLCMATVYAALGWFALSRRPEDARQVLVMLATAMAFVAAAIPLEAHAAWIPVGWAVQGAALWLFSLRIRSRELRAMAAAFLLLAVGRLVLLDTPYADRQPFVPILNQYALPALLVTACVLSVAAATRKFLSDPRPEDRAAAMVSGIVGVGLGWLILSVETYTYFSAQMGLPDADVAHLERSAQTALSVVWAAYAAVLLALGFRLRSLALRWAALVVFAVTLGKVFLIDMAELPGLYRVLAFFILALMMGAAAWGYQKFQQRQSAAGQEVMEHEPV